MKSTPDYNFGVEIECCVHKTILAELDIAMREFGFSCSTDGSIDTNDVPGGGSLDDYSSGSKWSNREYKGPVMRNYAAVRHLEEVLCLLYPLTEEKLFHTNSSCGFHVSVSIDQISASDVGKFHAFLAKNFPQKTITKLFRRTNNEYCQPTGVDLRRDDSYETLLEKLNENDSADDKYRVIANRGRGRVECRAMGGKHYHMKWKEIKYTLDNLFLSARRAYYAI